MTGKPLSAFLLAVSLFGLAAVAVSTLYPAPISEAFPTRKLLIGSAFVLLTVAGLTAVFSPDKCSRLVSLRRGRNSDTRNVVGSPRKGHTIRGHHPDCGNFSSHVIRVRSRTFCAGCAGLFIGGVISLLGALAYFFGGLELGNKDSLFVAIGSLSVGFGLILPILKIQLNLVRLLANAALPFGSLLILIGADSMSQSISLDAFLIVLIFFWLFTRISISQSGHRQVCQLCKDGSCELRGF